MIKKITSKSWRLAKRIIRPFYDLFDVVLIAFEYTVLMSILTVLFGIVYLLDVLWQVDLFKVFDGMDKGKDLYLDWRVERNMFIANKRESIFSRLDELINGDNNDNHYGGM